MSIIGLLALLTNWDLSFDRLRWFCWFLLGLIVANKFVIVIFVLNLFFRIFRMPEMAIEAKIQPDP